MPYYGEANMSRIGELKKGSRCIKKGRCRRNGKLVKCCRDFANRLGPRKTNKQCWSKSSPKRRVNCTRQRRAMRAAKRRGR